MEALISTHKGGGLTGLSQNELIEQSIQITPSKTALPAALCLKTTATTQASVLADIQLLWQVGLGAMARGMIRTDNS